MESSSRAIYGQIENDWELYEASAFALRVDCHLLWLEIRVWGGIVGFVGWRDKDFWIKERSDCHERGGLPERTLAGDIAVLIILIAIGLGVWIWYASL